MKMLLLVMILAIPSIIAGLGIEFFLVKPYSATTENNLETNSFDEYFNNLQQKKTELNLTNYDLDLINKSGNLQQVRYIVNKFLDVNVKVKPITLEHRKGSYANSTMDVEYFVNRNVSGITHSLVLDILFNANKKIISTLGGCGTSADGSAMGSSIENPDTDFISTCIH